MKRKTTCMKSWLLLFSLSLKKRDCVQWIWRFTGKHTTDNSTWMLLKNTHVCILHRVLRFGVSCDEKTRRHEIQREREKHTDRVFWFFTWFLDGISSFSSFAWEKGTESDRNETEHKPIDLYLLICYRRDVHSSTYSTVTCLRLLFCENEKGKKCVLFWSLSSLLSPHLSALLLSFRRRVMSVRQVR